MCSSLLKGGTIALLLRSPLRGSANFQSSKATKMQKQKRKNSKAKNSRNAPRAQRFRIKGTLRCQEGTLALSPRRIDRLYSYAPGAHCVQLNGNLGGGRSEPEPASPRWRFTLGSNLLLGNSGFTAPRYFTAELPPVFSLFKRRRVVPMLRNGTVSAPRRRGGAPNL